MIATVQPPRSACVPPTRGIRGVDCRRDAGAPERVPIIQWTKITSVVMLSFFAQSTFAEVRITNVDELPHNTILLPNGNKAEVIHHQDHNWRITDATILTSSDDQNPDVCFEAKFDSLIPNDKIKLFGHIKLFGLKGTIIVNDPLKLKAAAALKRGDNVWFCGTLLKPKDSKLVELHVNDWQKQLPDLQRFKNKIAILAQEQDAEGLIEMGNKIEIHRKTNVGDFADYAQYGILQDKAVDLGLALKEQTLKADDADGFFALGIQYKNLRNRTSNYQECVLMCLNIDPDHPQASRIAQDEFKFEKFERKWMCREDIEKVLIARRADQLRIDSQQLSLLEAQARARDRSIADRASYLMTYQKALCTNDPKSREGALISLGEAVEKSVDIGFGEEAIDILVNTPDPAAVFPGLDFASKSPFPEVRRLVFEALAWRGGLQDQVAFDVLVRALKVEKNVVTARCAVEALTALGGNPAINTLVAAVDSSEAGTRNEIFEGLKGLTRQSMKGKDAWREWWSKNKSSFSGAKN